MVSCETIRHWVLLLTVLGLCQVDVARRGFASDETATQTFGLGTGHLMPKPEGTCA